MNGNGGTDDRRVIFDFEADFSNGGGIQGQGFRLDIDGEDISDDSLAEYIIRDLRLLMVGTVRILNKTIIRERHKRSASPSPILSGPTRSRFVDLSHAIGDGMVTLPGHPPIEIGTIAMVANTGTYLDVPFHRHEGDGDLEALDLDRVSDVPAVVVRVAGQESRAIDWTHFVPIECRGRAILVNSGWVRHWGTAAYHNGFPYLTERAAAYMRDRGAVLVGIDTPNIDDTSSRSRPVHALLLEARIPIIQNLTGLDRLPADGLTFSAVPPRIRDLGTFPVRAHARIPA